MLQRSKNIIRFKFQKVKLLIIKYVLKREESQMLTLVESNILVRFFYILVKNCLLAMHLYFMNTNCIIHNQSRLHRTAPCTCEKNRKLQQIFWK